MNPKKFLIWSGLFFLVLAVLGFVWPGQQLYPTFYLDQNENWGHLTLGLVILATAYWIKNVNLKKWLVVLIGILAVHFGVWGFVISGRPEPNYYGITNLEIFDNLIHLTISTWALFVAFWKRK